MPPSRSPGGPDRQHLGPPRRHDPAGLCGRWRENPVCLARREPATMLAATTAFRAQVFMTQTRSDLRLAPDRQVRDLPDPPRDLWRIVGPGIVAAGVGLSSG